MNDRSRCRSRLPAIAAVLSSLCAAAISAEPAATQDAVPPLGPSILTLLPIAGEVAVGTELAGDFSASSYVTVTGVKVVAYRLTGGQGDPVTIDLISDAIDAYLYLVGPGYEDPLTDDDSGGACNARLSVFLPENGPYHLVVGSLGGDSGPYSLRIADRGSPRAEGDCVGGELSDEDFEASLLALEIEDTLEPGVPLMSELTEDSPSLADGSVARAWWFLGTPGEAMTFDLMSEEFDAMLMILEEEGVEFLLDDDGGSECNSRITLDVASSEPYRVVVTSIGAGLGQFTLTLSTEPEPVTDEPCTGR